MSCCAASRLRVGSAARGLWAQQQPRWLVRRVRQHSSAVAAEAAPAAGSAADGGGELQATAWAPGSRRCGALAVKCGMMSLFDGYGVRRAVTVMLLDDVQVTQVKSPPRDELTALQVGIGTKRAHRVPKAVRNHFELKELPVKQKVAQFSVTPDALMPVGTQITARHFVPGQFVDVQVRRNRPPLPTYAPAAWRSHRLTGAAAASGGVQGQGHGWRDEASRVQGRTCEPWLLQVPPKGSPASFALRQPRQPSRARAGHRVARSARQGWAESTKARRWLAGWAPRK